MVYYAYVYHVLVPVGDSAGLSKQCLAIGRMACFAVVRQTVAYCKNGATLAGIQMSTYTTDIYQQL